MDIVKAVERCKYITEDIYKNSIIDMRDKEAIKMLIDAYLVRENFSEEKLSSEMKIQSNLDENALQLYLDKIGELLSIKIYSSVDNKTFTLEDEYRKALIGFIEICLSLRQSYLECIRLLNTQNVELADKECRIKVLHELYNDACKSIATDTILKDVVTDSIEWHKNALKFDCNGNENCYNYAIEVLTTLLKTIVEVGD